MKKIKFVKITLRCKNRIFAHNFNPKLLLRECLYIFIAIINPHIDVKLWCFIINSISKYKLCYH